MREIYSMHSEVRSVHQILVRKLKEKRPLWRSIVDDKIILKWVVRK